MAVFTVCRGDRYALADCLESVQLAWKASRLV